MGFSVHSTVKEILESDKAKAVIEKHLPGIGGHPNLHDAYYMSLKECSYYPEAGDLGSKLDAIDADLRAIGD